MKILKKAIVFASVLALSYNAASGQLLNAGAPSPAGAIIYSLPVTTVMLEVTAECESFVAGPYAAYAEKYLGIQARTESADTYTIKAVKMYPAVEADPSLKVAVNLGSSKNASANFLNFCTQGLIMASDAISGKPFEWRFPSKAGNDIFAGAGVSQNLDSRTTTLYKTVRTAGGLEKVPVQQSQIVEKSAEKKAEQTASLIFKLRQTRIDIITGNTDATYSGEAMGAAIKEIDRLEKEYLSLFLGKSVKDVQRVLFDVTPKAGERQMYIAFRISDSQGLQPSSNMSGRPIVLELIPEGNVAAGGMAVESAAKGRIYYREPVETLPQCAEAAADILFFLANWQKESHNYIHPYRITVPRRKIRYEIRRADYPVAENLIRCALFGKGHPLFPLWVYKCAEKLEYVSRFVDKKNEKLPQSEYESIFTGYNEAVWETRDRLEGGGFRDYGDYEVTDELCEKVFAIYDAVRVSCMPYLMSRTETYHPAEYASIIVQAVETEGKNREIEIDYDSKKYEIYRN